MRDYNNSNRNSYNNRRGGDRPQMHDAVCAKCGADCKVPFRPTGNKPVYCSNCFEKESKGNSNRNFSRDDRNTMKGNRYQRNENTQSNIDIKALEEKLQKINEKVTVVIRMLEEQNVPKADKSPIPKKKSGNKTAKGKKTKSKAKK